MAGNGVSQMDTSSSPADPWQSSVNSLASMGKYLLTQSNYSDVTFKVGKDGQTEDISGHRILMAARSSVFGTMFFGSLPENKDFVRVEEVEPAPFKLMLEFLYTDDTKGINASNLIDVYKVAHKYDIAPLVQFCAGKVKDFISMEILAQYLDAKDCYDDKTMEQHIMAFLGANAWKLFLNEKYYKQLSHKHLMCIWEQDVNPEGPNKLREVDIFRGALTWARAECARKKLTAKLPTSRARNLRRVLGEALDLIRFPRMTLSEFYGIATQGGILTWEERDQIALYLVNTPGAKLPVGRPALGPQQASKTDHVRLPDGRLVKVPRDLLDDAVAWKRPPVTCGCNCLRGTPKQCKHAESRCRRIAAPLKKRKSYEVGDWATKEGKMFKAQEGDDSDVDWVEA